MTNEELLAKIKVEIDKLYGEYKDKFHQSGDQYHLGLIDGLDMAERVLSTLESEKPMDQDGLEEEMDACWQNWLSPSNQKEVEGVLPKTEFAMYARHFAEWGYLRAAEKYNEIEYNRQRAEENEKPSVKDAMKELDEKIALVKQRGTWDGVDVDKYMDEVRGRESEKPMEQEKEVESCHRTRKKLAEWSKTPEGRESYEKVAEEMRKQIVPNDLEEAADNHIRRVADAAGHPGWDWETQDIADAFIVGSKWQAEQDEKEQADLFTIVALDAAQRAKEQMMKEAVEGVVMDFSSNQPRPQVDVLLDPHKYHTGDKVRVIIVKE